MQSGRLEFRHGAVHLGGNTTRFRVWAPRARKVLLRLLTPRELAIPMQACAPGYWEAVVEDAPAGARYFYRLDDGPDRPDPASRCQPEGVHGPSEVVNPEFPWQDSSWRGLVWPHCVIYELHVGAYTPQGTFEALIPHLDYLHELGVTLLQLMPVGQFPGERNWGYDVAYPFAVQNSYGGPEGLKRLVNESHKRGLGVALDVIYNHLGPEGNYLADFGPYFTQSYATPWGPAINFDGPDSDEVRRFFIENALYWIREFHIDALRLDAVHGIFDRSAYPFLDELGDRVRQEAQTLNRRVQVIPESDLNDPRLVRSKALGGFGLDAQWCDDFHHALRVLLTGDRRGYYEDFGRLDHLAKAFRQGYVYSGQYSSFRRRRHGTTPLNLAMHNFVVFSQNHDQVGNRMLGERLAALASWEDLKVAAAAVILSPFIPLLFMGEEYAERAPFLYFVSHSDPQLVEAVRRGRREEFAAFGWPGEPPDPQAPETFLRSKLDLELRGQQPHRTLLDYYRELLRLRKELPPPEMLTPESISVQADPESNTLWVLRAGEQSDVLLALCFSQSVVRAKVAWPAGCWRKRLDSSDPRWLGPGGGPPEQMVSAGVAELLLNPRSAVLYRRPKEV